MQTESSLREEMVALGRRLHARGLVAASDGNLSARLPGGGWLVTPSGCCLGDLEPRDLLVVGAAEPETQRKAEPEAQRKAEPETQRKAEPETRRKAEPETQRKAEPEAQPEAQRAPSGEPRPTSEWPLHRTAYAERPDIGAIVHAHPPHATALTIAGLTLTEPVLPEVVVMLGPIPTAPYATPSGEESAQAIREPIRRHDALLLDRHGAVTVGATLAEAGRRMEKLEHCAQVIALAHRLGRVRTLDAGQVERLAALRAKLAP